MSERKKRRLTARKLYRKIRGIYARLVHCPSGRHRVDRSKATWRDGGWNGRCRDCGAPLRRVLKDWVPRDTVGQE